MQLITEIYTNSIHLSWSSSTFWSNCQEESGREGEKRERDCDGNAQTHNIPSLQSAPQHICRGLKALTLLHNSTAPPQPPTAANSSAAQSDQWQRGPGQQMDTLNPFESRKWSQLWQRFADRPTSNNQAKYCLHIIASMFFFFFLSPFLQALEQSPSEPLSCRATCQLTVLF